MTSPPVWLRLSRQGNVITAAFRASAADPWTEIGREAIDLPATALVGVAVSSHEDGTLAAASFESVSLTP